MFWHAQAWRAARCAQTALLTCLTALLTDCVLHTNPVRIRFRGSWLRCQRVEYQSGFILESSAFCIITMDKQYIMVEFIKKYFTVTSKKRRENT